HARLLPPRDVYVYRGRIAAIVPAGAAARDAASTVDGAGRVLMPALIDMHAHEDTWNLLLQIAGGVTTSRDMGNDNTRLQEIISQLESGEIVVRASSLAASSRATARTRRAAASASRICRERSTPWTGTRSTATGRSRSTTPSIPSGCRRPPPAHTSTGCA